MKSNIQISNSKNVSFQFCLCLAASAMRIEHATAALNDSTSSLLGGVGIHIIFELRRARASGPMPKK
jgi:hypothetical protein